MSVPEIQSLTKGDVDGTRRIELSRADLVRYAAASGDHNPIHWNERFALEVGLDGVIAHGMLTMGAAVQLVTDWAGDPAAVVDYQTRFARPVPVPDAKHGSPETPTAALGITGKVGALDTDAGTARIDLTVELLTDAPAPEQDAPEGQSESAPQEVVRTKVLAKSQAVVRL